MHKTSAWPLALMYVALIVFASLFPFVGWRAQGLVPWDFFTQPLPPRYWTGFDVATNIAGYMPLGFLLALALLRTGWPRTAVPLAALAGALLSLAMESLQIYLPQRVPSNLDWLLNSAGALAGALVAALLERLGAIDRWSRFRARWFVADARGALVLLALWPVGLLFPLALPFGVGQVIERLEAALADALADTAFDGWLPADIYLGLDPLSPGAELVAVALGLALPCLLGYSIIRHMGRRAVFVLASLAVGVAVTTLSVALGYGPMHALEWSTLPARAGIGAGLLAMLLLLPLPRRAALACLLLALVVHQSVLNQAPESPYFAQTLAMWEQGRFIHFYGLAQWIGWLWPYAAMLYAVLRLSARETTAARGAATLH